MQISFKSMLKPYTGPHNNNGHLYLTDKGEHTMLYKIYKNVYI